MSNDKQKAPLNYAEKIHVSKALSIAIKDMEKSFLKGGKK